jgi:Fe-S cluster assembly ATP-binding protein
MKNSHLILNVQNLHANVGDKVILQGLDLQIKPGEVHAIMGPNGSGKSTLGNILACKENYTIQAGDITFLEEDLLSLTPEACAARGLFLGFQYPVSIPGVSNIQFLKTALNAIRKHQGKPPMDALDFLKIVKSKMADLDMVEELLYRSVNDGFSGGEKKRNEILQMSLLEPKLAILDETDSGLDIDALKAVANGINVLRHPDRAILLITHYQRLLDYIVPDFVHVLSQGKIVKSGDKSLALELEEKGYAWLNEGDA